MYFDSIVLRCADATEIDWQSLVNSREGRVTVTITAGGKESVGIFSPTTMIGDDHGMEVHLSGVFK